MEYAWYIYILAFGGAALAGAINTMAGNGSVITLSILTELVGLPGNVANGTNRIGVLFSGIGGMIGFHRGGMLDLRDARESIITVIAGAIVGCLIALNISNEQFMWVFRVLMVCMLVVILARPSRWLKKERGEVRVPKAVLYILWFALGVYGGLIQMGMGVFFLAVFVLVAKYPIIRANAIKATVVAIYTLIVIAMFQYRGFIEWEIGTMMGIGQFAGGWMTAKWASYHPAAAKWAYGCLVVIIVVSLLSAFQIL